MQPVTIYTTKFCPYCVEAKGLLCKKAAAFDEIDVSGDRVGRAAMIERANGRTSVPQIFIGKHHIGGCDDLHELEATGKLDELLAT